MLMIFDVVGTLFSLEKVRLASINETSKDITDLWFIRVLQTVQAATLAGSYIPFTESVEASLHQVLTAQGLNEEAAETLMGVMQELDPWEDAEHCLETLSGRGYTLVALTNSSTKYTEHLLQQAGLARFFSGVFSADEVHACKPHPAPYQFALKRMGTKTACMVAAHGWDILGAHAVGMETIWISRLEKRWPFPGTPPGATVHALSEIPNLVQ